MENATPHPSPSSNATNSRSLGWLGRVSLAQWILVAVFGGIAFGFLAPGLAGQLQVVSDLFLGLIRAIIAPLLFGVLVRAFGGIGSGRELGRIGWKALLFFEIGTTIALLLGWVTAVVSGPDSRS